MLAQILTDKAAAVSEFKKKPLQLIEAAQGEAVAILNHNKPVFYAVPAELYAQILDQLDDLACAQLAEERIGGPTVKVSLDDL